MAHKHERETKEGVEFVQSLYMQWLQFPMQDIIVSCFMYVSKLNFSYQG